MFFDFKILDLPPIPNELVVNITPGTIIRNHPGQEYTRNGVSNVSAPNPFYKISAELERWIQDNICKKYNEVGIRYTHGSSEYPASIVHPDETSSCVLMYNLDHGGGWLNFWQQWGHGVVRDDRYVINNYENVIRISQYETPNFCWYMVNTKILHSIENMKSTRINIQVSLDSAHYVK